MQFGIMRFGMVHACLRLDPVFRNKRLYQAQHKNSGNYPKSVHRNQNYPVTRGICSSDIKNRPGGA
jgi:hypothetical protein